jgi:hypothetical protein
MNSLINWLYGKQENNLAIKDDHRPQWEQDLTLPPIEALIFMA